MLTIAARKIDAIRKAFGLSMERFGARYGVNKQRVYKWENGLNVIPSPKIINQMHNDGVVDRNDWYESDPAAPLLCGSCERRLDDPVNAGCVSSGCPRHIFNQMPKAKSPQPNRQDTKSVGWVKNLGGVSRKKGRGAA